MKRLFVFGAVVIVAAAVAGFLYVPHARLYTEAWYERAQLFFVQDADYAHSLGVRHFDARRVEEYDIQHAEYFFSEALRLDPQHPTARHELARIAFLRGDFEEALALIDQQLEEHDGEPPNSHYIRGLILSFMERYAEAATSFEMYLESNPNNWAALNDLAWTFLKDGRPEDAAYASVHGLVTHPENPWLLNSLALALFEMGDVKTSHGAIRAAARNAIDLSEEDWLKAYPGNDPRVASIGIAAFRDAIADNMHRIALVVDAQVPVE